jgi:hypothetical protein
MSKPNPPNQDERRPEYDFGSMKGGVRAKYAGQLRREGSNLVLLEPEIAKAFPSDTAVNDALRAVLNTTHAQGKEKFRNKGLRPASRARGLGKKRKPARTARG